VGERTVGVVRCPTGALATAGLVACGAVQFAPIGRSNRRCRCSARKRDARSRSRSTSGYD
jgi:hypothetical protein